MVVAADLVVVQDEMPMPVPVDPAQPVKATMVDLLQEQDGVVRQVAVVLVEQAATVVVTAHSPVKATAAVVDRVKSVLFQELLHITPVVVADRVRPSPVVVVALAVVVLVLA